LLNQVQCRDGVLANGFLIVIVQFGVTLFDDFTHTNLSQLKRAAIFIAPSMQ